ncbi:MAG: ferrous iron transport protein B [Thermodesulfobacteriota bacterium]
MSGNRSVIALAGQPNCGKSTVFNLLTGAYQHVANYPGVTVEKKVGFFSLKGNKYELVDLPGAYSLTSYSLEERVARDFLLSGTASGCVHVIETGKLKRSLFLTLQLAEMGCPLVLALNMMDKAGKNGLEVDAKGLARRLGTKVVSMSARYGRGKKDLLEAVADISGGRGQKPRQVDYGALEGPLREINEWLDMNASSTAWPRRWLALKLLEGDPQVREKISAEIEGGPELIRLADQKADEFADRHGRSVQDFVAARRYKTADEIVRACLKGPEGKKRGVSDRIDAVVCNRFLGPVIMVGIVYMLYELSIVQGYNLTNYTWPILAKIKEFAEWILPARGFVQDPIIRSMALWLVDSVNALLNYIPIFVILFGLIAVLEDSGYMPRMAFILDRLLQRFGMHGQSTLPLVLGGVYVGGCAVPAVMSTKGIPDHRARLTTILVIPMLNCLAKTPLYILLINTYFSAHKGLAMFFISTISLLMVLPTAKILSLTVLRKEESAPFIMEMPDYHLPTLGGVLRPALQKVWLFVRKIISIVAAVAVIVFVLLRFPGISDESMQDYKNRADTAIGSFMQRVEDIPGAESFARGEVMQLVRFAEDYKQARMTAGSREKVKKIMAEFKDKNPLYMKMVMGGPGKEFRPVRGALKRLVRERKKIRMDMQKERIDRSFLGRAGKAMEPVTKWAGFNWRVNVALLSALAAKENTVATLGALYQEDAEGHGNKSLEQSMADKEEGFTPLHALALMIFMVLYPPCLATLIAIKLQTGQYRYMFLSLFYQIILGVIAAVAIFTGGSMLGLSGLQAMFAFYGLVLALAVFFGLLPNAPMSLGEAGVER